MTQVIGESGPAVLLLPGGAEAVEGFFPGLIEGLVADPGCRVILYDRPGAGDSAVDGGLADASGALHAMIGELGIGPVVVIGQSLGGAVALLLAADHPDDVAGLVLLDPTPISDRELASMVSRRMGTMVKLFRMPVIGRLLRSYLVSSAEKSARRHDMTPEASAATRKIADVDMTHLAAAVVGLDELAEGLDLSRIPRVPAVVVTADRKGTSSIRRAHETLATAIGASLVSWPGAEHEVHLTHQHEVLELSRDVVRQVIAADD